jgi:hypothetical protein
VGETTQHRLHTAAWLVVFPRLAEKGFQLLIIQGVNFFKGKAATLKGGQVLFTVFRDESIWAAINRVLRPWLFILKIFLILLMLIVKLAILEGIVCCPQKMVTSTAFATTYSGSVYPEIPWSICRETGGQLAPEGGGHVHQNLHSPNQWVNLAEIALILI